MATETSKTSPKQGFDFSGEYALYLDEYELTMSHSFFLHNQHEENTSFEVMVRSLPKNRGYLVFAGLEQVVHYLQNLRFSPADITFLQSQGLYTKEFLDYLKNWRFRGSLVAAAEGTVVGPSCPTVRVTAPRIDATIIESALLSILNHQTMIASKAARIVLAAKGRPVWDFSLRRLHGPDASLGVARAAYTAGCAGTATVAAGKLLGLPTTGTMAHHYIQRFGQEHELEAFEQFLHDYPQRAVLLVDTFDVIQGIKNAIIASKNTGVALKAIRLDSGDLVLGAKAGRELLDAAGPDFKNTGILASNDLDEYKIAKLLAAKAPIDSFGVGTMMGTSADAPSLGGVYKLVEQVVSSQNIPTMKLSSEKSTDPGKHQVYRRKVQGGILDTIALEDEVLPGKALLQPILVNGKLVTRLPELAKIRAHCQAQLSLLSSAQKKLINPELIRVKRSAALDELRYQLGYRAPAVQLVKSKQHKNSYPDNTLIGWS